MEAENAPLRLLVAFAHPDDESFGPAGTIARYASQGVAVHYLCATRGEAGEVDSEFLRDHKSVAELRTAELRCAARHLGLSGLHLLDYRDSGMENSPENQHAASLFQAPLDMVVEQIVLLIRQIRPQVIITFDASGGSLHPDHIKMHKATTEAFHTAGDTSRYGRQLEDGLAPYQPQKLYYTTFPRTLVKLAVRVMPLFGQNPAAMGRNKDIDLRRIAETNQTITTRINVRQHYDTRQQAVRCHASQSVGNGHRAFDWASKWLFRYDTFARAEPPFGQEPPERDLFAGVEEPDA